MKKIITATFFNEINYGAVLQAYALQRKLIEISNKSIDCKVLNYEYNNNKQPKIRLSLNKGNLVYIYSIIMEKIYHKECDLLKKKFFDFVSNKIRKTDLYNTYNDVKNNPPEADLYIVGSDQVWNVEGSMGVIPSFDLKFVKNGVKASYAASTGVSDNKSANWQNLIESLEDYKYISVRENKTRELIEKELNREVRVDIDPVFLLDKSKWNQLIEKESEVKNIKGKYILCFILLRNDMVGSIVRKLKKETGLPVKSIAIKPSRKTYGGKLLDVGPIDFINLIKNAEYVVTTSFHGAAFSILFNKNFYVMNNKSPQRIENLLNICGISNRMIHNKDDFDINPINYDDVNKRLKEYIQDSENYLHKLLSSIEVE